MVVLPLKLSRNLGTLSQLVLVSKIGAAIHVMDPLTLKRGEIDKDKYFRSPFTAIKSCKALIEYTVLDSTPVTTHEVTTGAGGRPVRPSQKKHRLAEVEVVRNSDFGVNDTKFTAISHLGRILHAGDTVLGYDLTTSVFNDQSMEALTYEQAGSLPEVILVRKLFPRATASKKKRNFYLKKMEGVEESSAVRKSDRIKEETDREQFMDELEQDKYLRSQINLYKNTSDQPDQEDASVGVPLEELLEELTVDEKTTTTYLSASEAMSTSQFELEGI